MLSALGTPDAMRPDLETAARANLVMPFSPWQLADLVCKPTSQAATSGLTQVPRHAAKEGRMPSLDPTSPSPSAAGPPLLDGASVL